MWVVKYPNFSSDWLASHPEILDTSTICTHISFMELVQWQANFLKATQGCSVYIEKFPHDETNGVMIMLQENIQTVDTAQQHQCLT